MIEGIQPNKEKIKEYLDNSLMLVTALAPSIGYEKASKIAQLAHEKNLSLREASSLLNYLDQEEFDKLTNPKSMIEGNYKISFFNLTYVFQLLD